jgi:DNA polymerase sigma
MRPRLQPSWLSPDLHYCAQAAEYPALRPLVLVLKCVLGQAGLNDASKGGLSSFALANMALASLQEDAKVSTQSHLRTKLYQSQGALTSCHIVRAGQSRVPDGCRQ